MYLPTCILFCFFFFVFLYTSNIYVVQNCEFDWSSSVQGRMLGAFLYGYILTTMVGGFISNRCGVKTPFMFSGIGNITFHLLCPTAALMNSGWLFACRFLQGMCSVNILFGNGKILYSFPL